MLGRRRALQESAYYLRYLVRDLLVARARGVVSDAARVSCRVARAVESGLRGRRSCVCTRAVAQRAGGQQWAADAAGQHAILAGGTENLVCDADHSFQSHTTPFFEVGQRS